jgi:Fe2+ or Zn2+ uptake regulation protein
MKSFIVNILKKLSCLHKWKTYQVVDIADRSDRIIGYNHTLICQECGKIKTIKL